MDLELIWEEVLSEDDTRVWRAWNELTDEECEAVMAHLERMATEADWQPVQKQAAESALRIIRDHAARF